MKVVLESLPTRMELIALLYSVLVRPHLGYLVPFWVLYFRGNIDRGKAIRTIEVLKNMPIVEFRAQVNCLQVSDSE